MKNFFNSQWELKSDAIIGLSENLASAVVILILCWFVSKLSRAAIVKLDKKSQKIDSTVIPILSTALKYLTYTIGVVIILDKFGVNTSSIIALLGTVGLAVGFALKDTLSNIAAGIMLLILRPFKVDEFIEFSSISGKVKEINLFTTILETADGLYISSPNSSIFGNSIKNFNRNGKRRLDIIVGISYNDSIEKGLKVLNDIIASDSRLLKTPAPQSMVVSMGDSCVNLQLRAWANNEDYWSAYWDLHKRVKEEVEAAGLSIPFPQTEVTLINK